MCLKVNQAQLLGSLFMLYGMSVSGDPRACATKCMPTKLGHASDCHAKLDTLDIQSIYLFTFDAVYHVVV